MLTDIGKHLSQPLPLGNRTLANRLVLAPMTFLGHVAFRELLAGFGGYGLMVSEMCSAKAIPRENRRVSPYFRWRDAEAKYLSFQLLGRDPAIMAEAARRIEAEGLFGVDINFGCSATLICRQNSGAALLKEPVHAARIVAAVRKAVKCPVTVKFRTGWRDDPEIAVDLAQRFEQAGADGLIFHPRVAPDRRARPPRWEQIARVKAAVSVPVFGNGDLFTLEDCQRMVAMTGCDGVALGRIAVARPWIFAQWSQGFCPAPDIYPHTVLRLAELLYKHYDPSRALPRFRRFAGYFSANFRFGHSLHTRLRNAKDLAQIRSAVREFFRSPPELVNRPNMNFFY
jgi:nifR3 family TIM-barrel protein